MKNKYVVRGIGVAILLVVLIAGSAWGHISDKPQNGPKGGPGNCHMCSQKGKPGLLPDEMLQLDENQKVQAKTLRLEMLKEITPLKNELKILKAQLHAQSVGDKVDENSVYKLMEKISDKKLDIDKIQFQFQRKFRLILTDDQNVLFDADGDMMERPAKGKGLEGRPCCEKRMQGCRNGGPSPMPVSKDENRVPEEDIK